MSLTNKVGLVTGASSGIGAAIAIKFIKEGANVAIVGRNEEKLKSVSEICEKAGNKPLVIVADVSKDNDAVRIVNETVKHFQKLDILVNNAGIGPSVGILEEKAMQVFDKVMNTNLRSCVYITHLAAKHLIETKGNIINISSIASLRILVTRMSSYSTLKAGLDQFTRAIASELASQGVRVNGINPGPVKTDIIENTGAPAQIADAAWDALKQQTALKRISEPKEIAELALFLASEKAAGITGAIFVIDNGFLVNSPLI